MNARKFKGSPNHLNGRSNEKKPPTPQQHLPEQMQPISPAVISSPSMPILKAEELLPQNLGQSHLQNVRWIAGIMSLPEFIHKRETEQGITAKPNADAIIKEWRLYNNRFLSLQSLEKGVADNPHPQNLPTDMQPLCQTVYDDPTFKREFGCFNTEIRYVDLDKVVVHQQHIFQDHVDRLKDMLSDAPTNGEIFSFCFSHDCLQPTVTSMQMGDHYVFTSQSNDLRFLEHTLLRPEQISEYAGRGTISQVVSFAIGYGGNFLAALSINDGTKTRLILSNGSHRSVALWQKGITRVPCLVIRVADVHEAQLLGFAPILQNPLYMAGARPPLLKDYCDPKLSVVLKMPRTLRKVKVSVTVEQEDVPVA